MSELERLVRVEERLEAVAKDVDEIKPMVTSVYDTVTRWSNYGTFLRAQATATLRVVSVAGVIATIAFGLYTIGGA